MDGLKGLESRGINPFEEGFDVEKAIEKLYDSVPDDATDEEVRRAIKHEWNVLEQFMM
jgi:hypothetical protein